jgi:thiamine biosynthesis lipoprotein
MTSAADPGSPKSGGSDPGPPPGAPRGLNRRGSLALPLCAALLLALALHRLVCAPTVPGLVEFAGPTMGTTWSVKIADLDLGAKERDAIAEAIADELERVDRLMSTWNPDSELSRFNRHASSAPFAVSPETFAVFEIAEQVSEQSEGAFDITVGPLVAAWGFGATDRPPQPPTPAELADIEGRVGWRLIHLDPSAQTISKAHPEAQCDLSAIAKGYAVDRVADALLALGQEDFLVEIGGELRARGAKLDGRRWRIGIERPGTGTRSTQIILEVSDRALATSGDYRSYYEEKGERISHTIDPLAGRPIRHGLASVSVIHGSATWADALATALNVMGPERGVAWAESEGLAAFFLVRDEPEGFREIATSAFVRLRVRSEVGDAGR